jgi:hypothetical protein
MPPPPVRKRREGGQRLEGRYVRRVCVCVCVCVTVYVCVYLCKKENSCVEAFCLSMSVSNTREHTHKNRHRKRKETALGGNTSRLAAEHIHHTINTLWHKQVPAQEGSAQGQLVSTGRHFDAPECKGLACQNDAHSRYNFEARSTCLFAI